MATYTDNSGQWHTDYMANLTSYYNVNILRLDEDNDLPVFQYELCGWIYRVSTLDEAKAHIKANIAEHRCYWRNF